MNRMAAIALFVFTMLIAIWDTLRLVEHLLRHDWWGLLLLPLTIVMYWSANNTYNKHIRKRRPTTEKNKLEYRE